MLERAVRPRDGVVLLRQDLFQQHRIGLRQAVLQVLVLGLSGIPLRHGAGMQMLVRIIERRETGVIGDPELQGEKRLVHDVEGGP